MDPDNEITNEELIERLMKLNISMNIITDDLTKLLAELSRRMIGNDRTAEMAREVADELMRLKDAHEQKQIVKNVLGDMDL